jgi:mycothiol S-conjugate amidase
VTYPEGGGYPHPDHIRCHDVSVAAYHAAADGERFPEAGPPWEVSKLYYVEVHSKRGLEALHQACLDRGIESPFAERLQRWDPDHVDPTSTRIEVGDYLSAARQALIAHATQIDPNGSWFSLPDEHVREVYPYEEFELAHSRVQVPDGEDSLFAGIAPGVGLGSTPE